MKYFQLEEFACNCCGENKIDPEFVEMLDEAREIAGFPFVVTSGYRCERKNEQVGGVTGSAHTAGLAADISVRASSERYRATEAMMQVGFRRIGVSEGFLHCDIDGDKPQNVIWTY